MPICETPEQTTLSGVFVKIRSIKVFYHLNGFTLIGISKVWHASCSKIIQMMSSYVPQKKVCAYLRIGIH